MHFPSKIVLLHPFFSGFSAYFASTLGALYLPDHNSILSSLTDMNDVPQGHYTFWLSSNTPIAHFPTLSSSANPRCFVEIIYSPTGYQYQKVINVYPSGNREIYERIKSGSGAEWTTWVRNDNYGTSSLSELASALGVATLGVISTSIYIDENNELPSTWSDKPSRYLSISFKPDEQYEYQFLLGYTFMIGGDNSTPWIFVRRRDVNIWSGWYRITATSITQ